MPKKTATAKSKYNRNKSMYNRLKRLTSGPKISRQIISNTKLVKMRYDSGQIGTTTTGVLDWRQFKANSIYDPDAAIGGHQPMGRDEYSNFYNKYRVLELLIEVYAQMLTPDYASVISVYPHKSASYPTDISQLLETPDRSIKVFNAQKFAYIRKRIKMSTLFSTTKKAIHEEDDYASEFPTDPVNLGYVTILWQNLNGLSSTGHNIRAILTYTVELSEPKLLGQS